MQILKVVAAVGWMQLAAAQNVDPNAIVIADSIDWHGYPAFYVDASRGASVRMKRAIAQAIAGGEIRCPIQGVYSWVCTDTSFRYFQGITGDGKPSLLQLACSSDAAPRQAYYAEKLLHLVHCIELWKDPNGDEMSVIVPDDA